MWQRLTVTQGNQDSNANNKAYPCIDRLAFARQMLHLVSSSPEEQQHRRSMQASSLVSGRSTPQATKNASTADLLRESERLIRHSSALRPVAAAVPNPKSLSDFLTSFSSKTPNTRLSCDVAPEERLRQLRQRPWAKHLSDAELCSISTTAPSISDTDWRLAAGRPARDKHDGWRRRLAAILPKTRLPALEKLNADLSARMHKQAPAPRIRKAPVNWKGVAASTEMADEAGMTDDEERLGEAAGDEEEPREDQSTHFSARSDDDIPSLEQLQQMVPLVVDSDEEEETPNKIQTDITFFFGNGDKINPTIGNGHERTRKAEKESRKERRLRSAFFDEEAEEESVDESEDGEDAISGKVKRKKRRSSSHRGDEEEIDEEEIRRELAASKFIVEEGTCNEAGNIDNDLVNVHNRLEIERDAAAIQAVLDRFARDKLDPRSRHIVKLADKYGSNKPNTADASTDEEAVVHFTAANLTSDRDEDALAELIRADSDLSLSDEELSDYEEEEDEKGGEETIEVFSSRPSSAFRVDDFAKRKDDIVFGAATATPRFGSRISLDSNLLERLDSSLAKGQPQRLGFNVGNSISADLV